jgi:hypothetical protein
MKLEDYKKEYRKIVLKDSKRDMVIHSSMFFLIIVLLSILNYLKSPNNLWVTWVIFGWGIGILSHYFFGYKNMNNELTQLEAIAEMNAKNKS